MSGLGTKFVSFRTGPFAVIVPGAVVVLVVCGVIGYGYCGILALLTALLPLARVVGSFGIPVLIEPSGLTVGPSDIPGWNPVAVL
jgi:hypothetical protein